MISKTDIDVYNAFFNEKSITEKYLSSVPFIWTYSAVTYNADCTQSIPFDLFDKVLVGILTVDQILSIEQIGEILGMNLIYDPANQKYKDQAEYDILRMALDNLVTPYKMIEIGDHSYSSCRLTEIGKEYAAKGKKFITKNNEQFTIYFDNISGNHNEAKELFSRFNRNPQPLKLTELVSDEKLIKEICKVQQPHIYDIEKGNSFTNVRLNTAKSYSYELNLLVSLFFDIDLKEFRLTCIEPETKKEIRGLAGWLNTNYKEKIIQQYFSSFKVSPYAKLLPESYLNSLKKTKADLQETNMESPETIIQIVKKSYLQNDYIDTLYFWKNITDFVSADTEEIYLFINNPTDGILEILNLLVRSKISVALFLIIQKSEFETYPEQLNQLRSKCLSSHRKIFLLESNQLKNFAVWVKSKDGVLQYKNTELLINHNGKQIQFSTLEKGPMAIDKSQPICEKVKSLLVDEYVQEELRIISEYASKQKLLDDNKIGTELIVSYNDIGSKMNVFEPTLLNNINKENIAQIKIIREDLIGFQTERHKLCLLKRIENLSGVFNSDERLLLEETLKYKEEAIKLKHLIPPTYEDVIIVFDELVEEITNREKYIRDEIIAKTYIIDTNIFIEEPTILDLIDKKDYVSLSFTVIEELDKLKLNEKIKGKASIAIKNINSYLQKSVKEKQPRMKKHRANLKNLPVELQRKTGDNYILASAYFYKDKNPIILSNDNNLQVKSHMLDIPVVSLAEFKKVLTK
jgi:hypothetical protein